MCLWTELSIMSADKGAILNIKKLDNFINNEEEVDELILLIRDSFIPAFTALKDTLVKKLDEAESKWE